MKRQSLHVKDNAIYDQFTKQQVIWTHGYGATDRYVTRNEWGALLLQWPVHTNRSSWDTNTFLISGPLTELRSMGMRSYSLRIRRWDLESMPWTDTLLVKVCTTALPLMRSLAQNDSCLLATSILQGRMPSAKHMSWFLVHRGNFMSIFRHER